jgi:hypothetical protein
MHTFELSAEAVFPQGGSADQIGRWSQPVKWSQQTRPLALSSTEWLGCTATRPQGMHHNCNNREIEAEQKHCEHAGLAKKLH